MDKQSSQKQRDKQYFERLDILDNDKRLSPQERAVLQISASYERADISYNEMYKNIIREKDNKKEW